MGMNEAEGEILTNPMIFEQFLKECEDWTHTGKEPSGADQDMRWMMDLMEKRRRSHGLSMTIHFTNPDHSPVSAAADVRARMPVLNAFGIASYEKQLYYQPLVREIAYTKEGKRVWHSKRVVTAYETILRPREDADLSNTLYTCPSCGAIEKVSLFLQNGCPYCKASFRARDLWPKVSEAWCLDSFRETDKDLMNRIIRRSIIPAGIIAVLLIFGFHWIGVPWIISLVLACFAGVLSAFVILLLQNVIYGVKKLFQGGKILHDNLQTMHAQERSKQAMESLKQIDPSFSYEYFESEALSLTRGILLSDHRENLSQYRGKEDLSAYDDLVEMDYRGGIEITSAARKGENLQVEADLYMSDYYAKGNHLKHRNDVIHLTMMHAGSTAIDQAFSIHQITCPACGASFDAVHTRKCPYCGQPYPLAEKDWVVMAIHG
jgi:rubrerythrin